MVTAIRRHGLWVAVLGLGLSLSASLAVGRYPVPPQAALAILAAKLGGAASLWPPEMTTVLMKIRLPRILGAIEVGAALAVSGSAYQGLFRNPLVSPDILGVSAGAGFGAALAILLRADAVTIQLAAFFAGLLAVALTSLAGLSRAGVLVMILAGVIVGTVFSAGISLVKFAADPNNVLPAITFWLMGSLASVRMAEVAVAALPITVGIGGLLLLRWRLNLLCFGDEEARSLGVNVPLARMLVILCATLATASAVAISGVIGLVGLVVPTLARLLVGPDHRRLIPCAILLGGGYLLLVDDLARGLLPVELPLGILTSLLGAPLFLFLLFRTRRAWA